MNAQTESAASLEASRFDAAVVGGGLVGLCTALYLQRTGRTVVVIDPAAPGTGASGHNAGVLSLAGVVPTAMPGILSSVPRMLRDPLSPLTIRWAYLPRLAPWLLRFALASRPSRVSAISEALYQLVSRALDAFKPLLASDPVLETGAPAGLRPAGLMYVYRSEASFRGAAAGLRLRETHGIPHAILDNAEISRIDPQLAGKFYRAIHYPQNLHTLDPVAFTEGLSRRFVREGGTLHRAEVGDFEVEGGSIRSVVTRSGSIGADIVVIAAGAWSGPIARRLGVRVPLDTERGYGVHLPHPGLQLSIPMLSGDYHFALTPGPDGSLRLAGTDELAGMKAPPNFARARALVAAARTLFPDLSTEGSTEWMSFRPSMPDSLPIIAAVPGVRNGYLAFGHGHLGLTLAAITGLLVAEMADGQRPSVDLTPYRADRFGWLRP